MSTESDDVRRGIVALEKLRHREVDTAPDGLFEQIVQEVTGPAKSGRRPAHFWLGAGFGAAVAASIFALAFAFGMLASHEDAATDFEIALNEPRRMDIAIETDRELQGATITIILAGNVELEGFEGQRELSWSTDLDAGINRLSLPLIATGTNGGQLVVRLDHPQSEQVFVIELKPKA
jgi:hypothetical protein